eukprot:4860132-Prymnesium_polylepis.2
MELAEDRVDGRALHEPTAFREKYCYTQGVRMADANPRGGVARTSLRHKWPHVSPQTPVAHGDAPRTARVAR